MNNIIDTTTKKITVTIPVNSFKKSMNEKPAALPIMMFGGSPINVAVPPILEATISVKRSFTTDADQQESTVLYLGSTSNCSINKETGSIEGAYQFETLLLNNEQPLATYKLDSNEGENTYITPAYINEDENPSMLLVSIDKDKNVEVKGIYITKDDKGEALDHPQIQPIDNGTLIYPSYENYVAKKATIDQHYINAEELYDVIKCKNWHDSKFI